MKVLAACGLLAMVLLGGCLNDDDGDPTPPQSNPPTFPSASPTTASHPTPSTSPTPAPASNNPPTATLSATIEQGTIPFNVTFDLDGTDVDGDALNWVLDADGNGTGATGTVLPANYTHTYTAEGLYNVTFTVSDGTDTAVQTLVINATAAAASTGPVQIVDASWLIGVSDLGAPLEYILCETGPFDGILIVSFAIDSASNGLPFTATLSDASEGAAVDSWFMDFGDVAGCSFEGFSALGADDITGTVPAGKDFVVIGAFGGLLLDVHYEAG